MRSYPAVPPIYRLDIPAAAIANAFCAQADNDPWAGGYVARGQFAPVITAGREFIAGARPEGRYGRSPRRMVPRLWGVPPPPAAHDAAQLIGSVRNTDSPFWVGNLRNSEFRCIIPATAFMLWGRNDPVTGRRKSHWFGLADQPLFAMLGVCKDSDVPGFALLSCQPCARLKEAGCTAMPVILPSDWAARDSWLYGDWNTASKLLAPYASSMLEERSGPASQR